MTPTKDGMSMVKVHTVGECGGLWKIACMMSACACCCRLWLGFLAATQLITGPLALAQNPASVFNDTARDVRHVRTTRGRLFATLAAFFFVEGLGILARPNLMQRVSHFRTPHCCSVWHHEVVTDACHAFVISPCPRDNVVQQSSDPAMIPVRLALLSSSLPYAISLTISEVEEESACWNEEECPWT